MIWTDENVSFDPPLFFTSNGDSLKKNKKTLLIFFSGNRYIMFYDGTTLKFG